MHGIRARRPGTYLFDGVHAPLEVDSGGVHVGDHGADVSDDGGEDEDADEKVEDDEDKLDLTLRLRRLTDRRQRQR